MKRLFGCGLSTVLLAAGVVALAAWAVLTYVGLTRDEIRVEASWTRLENIWQRQMDLVPELIARVERTRFLDRELLDELAEAQVQASSIVLTPEVLNEMDRFIELQTRQERLSSSLKEALESIEQTGKHGLDAVARELRAAQEQAVRQGALFNDRVDHYNESIEGFPASLIARLFDFGRKPPLAVTAPGAPVSGTASAAPAAAPSIGGSDAEPEPERAKAGL